MADDSFKHDFVWYEWTFVAPEDAPSDEERVPETPATVGEWGDEWVWTM